VIAEMGPKKNWTDSDDLAMMYRGTFSAEFYKRLHRYIHRRFRMKQGLRYVKQFAGREKTLSRKEMRRIILLGYYLPTLILDMLYLTANAKKQILTIKH
jgi:anaerobic magnesium-protoporphyrin IX monomethyl ester cyclase